MKMLKRIVYASFAVILVMLTLIPTTVFAATDKDGIMVPYVLRDTYVYDQGDILDKYTIKQVDRLLDSLEAKTSIEFAVVTIPSLGKYEISDYGYKLATELKLGKKDKNNGLLLLISKTDSKVTIQTGKGMEGILPDSRCGRILDNFFVPHREVGEYDEAVLETVQAVINVIATSDEYSFNIEGVDSKFALTDEELKETEKMPPEQVALIVIAVIIFLIILEYVTGKMMGDGFGDGIVFLFLEAMAESGGSGGSRGSSGGSFGGGSFGGGGASR